MSATTTDDHRVPNVEEARHRRPRAVPDHPKPKVPPHNLEAEESLVGAMLLSRDAIRSGMGLNVGDFYDVNNGLIFGAIVSAFEKDESKGVDPVLAAEQLRMLGVLEQVGGVEAIIHLQANTGAIGNAARYASIVEEKAQARRLNLVLDKGASAAGDGDIERAMLHIDDAAEIVAKASRQKTLGLEDVSAVIRGEVPPLSQTILQRDDGACLIYPGLLHWIMGEHGLGKSWVALAAAAQILNTRPSQADLFEGGDVPSPAPGPSVLYLDWEGNRRIVGSRLRALGVTPESAEERFLYFRPPTFTKTLVARLVEACKDKGVVLAVFDGVAKALARQGLDEDKNSDVIAWLELVVSPLTDDANVAALCLDHVTKDKEARGRWARGATAKIDQVSGAAWLAQRKEAFSRNKAGSTVLIQKKDREGMLCADEDTAAIIRMEPFESGERLVVSVMAPTESASAPFRPTGAMAEISQALTGSADPLSTRSIRSLLNKKATTVDSAIERLRVEGYIRRVGKGPSQAWELVKPFIEDMDGGAASQVTAEEDGSWAF